MDMTPVGRDVLVENMDDAIVVVDTQGRIVDINPKAMELADPGVDVPFGKPVETVFSRWVDVIPQYAVFEGRIEIKMDRPPYFDIDFRIIPLKDRQGHLMGKLATWRDISARKQVEDRLRVFFHAVEQNPAAIFITDPEGRIQYVNPNFVLLTGYSLKDVSGKTPRILKSGETQDDVYDNLWKTIKAGQVWEAEVLNRKKSGDLYWVHELIAPVRDGEGQATHFVAMQQDITERKHTESELRVVNTRLQVQLTEIEALHDQLREEAIRDGLTRLFNRRFMEETLDREISRAERGTLPISVVMMDIDLFKNINDTYGHQAGDTVLQTLGTMLLENTRISDIACRYGGDEMLVVMPGAMQDMAVARAEEWRTAFSLMEFTFGEEKIKTTLSLGIASFPDQARNPIELLTAADKALYWAKTRRNQLQCYDPSTMGHSLNRSDDIR
jgi:diguanylate cyclase (GGDEF)-like protein/PAS domain S-box-containing protein